MNQLTGFSPNSGNGFAGSGDAGHHAPLFQATPSPVDGAAAPEGDPAAQPWRAQVEHALAALRAGGGVLVVDDEDRENEADLIFAARNLTRAQMAMLIRECSGIVCLCLPGEKVDALGLPMMVDNNTSPYQTAFTISIEAASGVTTGVSAADRLATVRAATAENARPEDLRHPGHVFPLRARPGGVLERPGHTEAVVDLARLAGLPPCGVLCELTNPDGSMARLPEARAFGARHGFPVVSIESLARYRRQTDASPV